MRRAYIEKNFTDPTLRVIAQAEAICREYAAQGFDLTLRQLYYQFVARGLIPNTQRDYKRLGSIVNDARLAGYLDWDYIVDRTRNLLSLPHWRDPSHIIRSAASSYQRDLWANQGTRVEVWIEKDALVGVIAGVCETNDVAYFSCRGYVSQSEMYDAAWRTARTWCSSTLGDHDPSGLDMTRDIRDRLELFLSAEDVPWWMLDVRRIALNMDQIQVYDPPPNPAKVTDSRAAGYIAEHGRESWELDALDPPVLSGLIAEAIEDLRDPALWGEALEEMESEREQLTTVAERWQELVEDL